MAETASAFRWPAGKRAAVSLTFDDARFSQVDVGLALLRRHGARATFYVSLDNVGPRLDAWRSAVAEGHEIANHAVRHPCSGNFSFARSAALEEYTLEQIEAEVLEANARIEALLGVRPVSYGYPCGQKFVGRGEHARSYVPVVARHFLTGRGFRDEAPNAPGFCDLAQLMGVDGDCQPFEESRRWIEHAAAEGGWLVFAGHEIGDGGRQVTLRSTLEAVCAYCQDPANGIWLDTMAAIGAYVRDARAAG